jgi:2-dehydro-3-deoxyphosphooctonate aldolase (KDO 8-P synthase)
MVALNDIKIGNENPLVLIAGPCVVENYEITMSTAREIFRITSELKIPFIFKSSFKKANRTSVNSFTGLRFEEARDIFTEVKNQLNVPLLTDVHNVSDIERISDIADIIQIPAFLCRQTDLLIAAGESGRIVNIKKGQFLAPADMKHAVEKVRTTGNDRILLTERGTTFGYHNLVVDMRSLIIMAELGYPVIMDATHAVQMPSNTDVTGGEPKFIEPLSKAAAAVGIAGLFLEVHPDPPNALSDAGSQLHIDNLEEILIKVQQIDRTVKGIL